MIELLRRFGGKFRRYMVIGPACKLIEVIFDLLTPLVIAQMIDKGIGAHNVNAVVHYGMVLGAMAVIGISFTLVCQKMAALTSQGMGTDIRGALYQHINKLSYAELDRFGTPSLITRITNDVNQVQLAVALSGAKSVSASTGGTDTEGDDSFTLTGTALLKSKKVFDNSKVTDHHAIIPTGQHPQNLTEGHQPSRGHRRHRWLRWPVLGCRA